MHEIKYTKLKGQEMPEAIGMTLIFLMIIVGLIMIAFLAYLKLNFNLISSDPQAYSVTFLSIATKPFMLSDVLTHKEIVDRNTLEHAIEMVATSSPENSNSEYLNGGLRLFLQQYKFSYYRVGIEVNEDTLFEVDNIPTRCGENDAGWCTAKSIGCDVGYVEVPDPKDLCTSSIFSYVIPTIPSRVCCTYDSNEYRSKGNARKSNPSYDIISCGNNRGVCSEGEKFFLQKPTECGEGQITLGRTQECQIANNGKTPLCCAERTDETEVDTGITTQAVVPLLYKDKEGRMEVEANGGLA